MVSCVLCLDESYWYLRSSTAGIKSIARTKLHEDIEKPLEKPGFAAYRATVDVSLIEQEPEVSWLLKQPSLNLWSVTDTVSLDEPMAFNNGIRVGDQRHVMTYTIGAGRSFNMVLSHPDQTDPSTWDQTTALHDMRTEFDGWDPKYVIKFSYIHQAHGIFNLSQTYKDH